ncbi:ABC transporter permease [Nocardia sp. NPDC088792]|uniref:ABC transporter permease n=1 Tax=Nocardia sp. NPDC088792 TaxID=3364332 RepID=UPI0037F6503B
MSAPGRLEAKAADSFPRDLWVIVTQREIGVKLRDRNFLISTLITIVVIAASLTISGIMANRTDHVKVATAGPEAGQIVAAATGLADAAGKKIAFSAHPAADTAAVEQQVRGGAVDAGLVPVDGGWRLIGKSATNDNATTYVTAAARQFAMQHNADAAGTSLDQLARGGAVSYDLLAPSAIDPGLSKVVAFAFAFLFYLSSILFGMAIAQSVVEEKQNRIVEILASAIPVRQLLIGKVVGNTVMALAQLGLFVGAGLIGLTAIGKGDQIAQIAGAAGWFIVFFLVGFLALASLWAVAGALATRTEDLQSTATPLSMLVMVVLFAGIFAKGVFLTVISYVPIVSIVAMPSRVAQGTASWWEPLPALAIMIAATYGIIVIAERIYRRSLLQTQRRLTIRQALAVED